MKISYKDLAARFYLPDFMPESGLSPVYYTWQFLLPVTPEELWPYVADTSLFNRHIGLAARSEEEKEGKKWVKTTVLGVPQEWHEEPWIWQVNHSIQYIRHYTRGITNSVRANFFLNPVDGGMELSISMVWIPPSKAHRWFLKITEPVIHSKFEQAFKTVANTINASKKGAAPLAFRKINVPDKNVNLEELEKITLKMKQHSLPEVAVKGLIDFIKFGDDADLYRIRAIELAENLNIPKRETIRACMQAVREGLLTISWDVVCPHCRGVRYEAKNLGEIPPNSECIICDIDFETDTLESIEVTFHVHPSFRKVEPVLFCTAEPAKKDHIQVQNHISAGGKFEFTLPLKEGRHRIRTQGSGQVSTLFFDVSSDFENKVLRWDTQSQLEKVYCGPSPRFVLENSSNTSKVFTLEQLWWKDNILHPVDIFAIQEYQDVFSRESLNSQVRMSLGVQTIMFTDIVNSTGFYSSRGDAAAFSQVRKHFTELFEIISKNEGTVIKTIGDSVMACFLSSDNALNAALQIQEAFHPARKDSSIRLRISMHRGQVIAVHLNQGLDLFGNSVNKAAKLQACAGSGEIALSLEFIESCHPLLLMPYKDWIQKRTSNLQLKELPLEAHVVRHHDALSAQQSVRRTS